MSRRLRVLFAALLVSFAFSATACAGGGAARTLGPSFMQCDTSNSNTCH